MQQRSEEWFAARLGKATSSRFGDVVATLRGGGEAAGRKNYRALLVVERLTGVSAEHYSSPAMQWGTDTEELARLAYTLKTGVDVEEAGFIEHPKLAAGASPDGLVGTEGLLEIKCPNTANHIATLRAQKMPPEHMPQVQGQMWITGRKWVDFVSYDPVLPPNAQLFIYRVERDDKYIDTLIGAVSQFLTEVDAEVDFLKGYK